MFRIDWSNPKVTSGAVEEVVRANIESIYDGLLVENGYLYVLTTEPMSSEQEDLIKGLIYSLNDIPAEVITQADQAPKDPDGSTLSRVKAASSGWTAQLHGVELEVGKLDSVIESSEVTVNTALKFYDDSDVELTTQEDIDAEAVKTVFDWEPAVDYEIIGGEVRIVDTMTDDIRVTVIGVPEIPAIYGGSKVMVTNINLRYFPYTPVKTDGRASKRLTYDATYHTSKLRFVFKHPVGAKLKLAIIFELYFA